MRFIELLFFFDEDLSFRFIFLFRFGEVVWDIEILVFIRLWDLGRFMNFFEFFFFKIIREIVYLFYSYWTLVGW